MCNCEAIKYIDAILKAEDDDLEALLEAEGFVDGRATILGINSLEDDIAYLLVNQGEYFAGNLTQEMLEEKTVIDRLTQLLDDDPTNTQAKELFKAFFAKELPDFAEKYLADLDMSLKYYEDLDTMDELTAWSNTLGDSVAGSSQEAFRSILTDAASKKLDVAAVTALLKENYAFSEGRARRMAFTETLRAHSYSQYSAYQQTPSIAKLKWVHNGAKDPRPWHQAMNDKEIEKDERFTVVAPTGTYTCRFPRDANLPATETVFCHCTVEGVVDVDFADKDDETVESVPSVSQEAKDRLYGPQKPMQYFNETELDPLENSIVEFTGGGISFSGNEAVQITSLIKNAEDSTKPLFRIEEAAFQLKNMKAGDVYESGIRSFSKSTKFVDDTLGDFSDMDYTEPAIIKIVGSSKSLNIQGYSMFTDQAESLTAGKFEVLNTTTWETEKYGKVKVIEVKQLEIPKAD
jgi:hypothetical protein